MSDQPEALFIADVLAHDPQSRAHHHAAVDCLRRQHAEIESAHQAQREAENELSRALARHAMAESALKAELREVTEAMDDPAINNVTTLAEAVRTLKAERDALRAHLRYWIPDETMIPAGHEAAWESARAAIDAAKEAGK